MYKTWTVIIVSFLLGSHSLLAQSNPYIFQIRCKSDGIESQTGFSVADKNGIITALHGVIKCFGENGRISAFALGSDKDESDLNIVSADIANDVALLSSQKIKNGLPIADCHSNSCISYREQYYVLGHPLGITAQIPTTVRIRQNFKPLETWLSPAKPEVQTAMRDRHSPDLTTQVFNVEGHLLHGHSGAPLINDKDEVIGVVNGGLLDGTVEIAWAIPYRNITLKSVSEIASTLATLRDKSIPEPLTFFGIPSDLLNLKILLRATPTLPTMEKAISQAVFKDRSADYLLPIFQSNSVGSVQQVVIMKGDNEVLARGELNTILPSSDEQYKFKVSNEDGVWVLSFTPVVTHKVTLILPSRMNRAEILVDGQPATIIEQLPTQVTVLVEGEQASHQFSVRKDSKTCELTQRVSAYVELTPCQ